jgi:1,4-alpha-glucan branching enzyme
MSTSEKITGCVKESCSANNLKHIKPRKVKFQKKAESGSRVFLVGTFNNWDPKAIRLRNTGNGSYERTVSLCPGRYEYKFLVNDTWQIDEDCRQWAPNNFGSLNSVIEVI